QTCRGRRGGVAPPIQTSPAPATATVDRAYAPDAGGTGGQCLAARDVGGVAPTYGKLSISRRCVGRACVPDGSAAGRQCLAARAPVLQIRRVRSKLATTGELTSLAGQRIEERQPARQQF